MNLTDDWEGYYEYGEGYSLPYFGERVNLIARFVQKGNALVGEINELESAFSIPLTAMVKGEIDDNIITYTKTYPKYPVILDEENKKIGFEDGELNIYHEGVVDIYFESIYGYWYIKETIEDEKCKYEHISSGIWLLKKQKKQ